MNENCRILFVGDIALGGEYATRVGQGSIDWTEPFVDVRPIFQRADLRVGNLEEPLHRGSTPHRKRNLLGAPPESAAALSFLDFTALSLGNNHITDQGVDGINRTREILESRGIAPFGAGEDLETAGKPAFAKAQNQIFALLAYAVQDHDVGSEAATDSAEGCVPLFLERVGQDIADARRSAEHVIVSLHWGYQYDRYPSPEQIAVAREIIDLGAVIVFGHHPHVLQGIERYKNGLILYSLGNFFFPDFVRTDGLRFRFPKESRRTAAVLCEVGEDGVRSFLTVPMKHDRDLRMRVLRGHEAAREERLITELSAALEDPEYETLWSRHHNRNVRKRCRHEEILQIRSEVLCIWRQLRERGFVGSLRSVKGRNFLGIRRLFRRVTRIF